jgi:hypothetical protein
MERSPSEVWRPQHLLQLGVTWFNLADVTPHSQVSLRGGCTGPPDMKTLPNF